MKKPLISVCVVTYNQQHYIRDCLMSVVIQEVDSDVEILIGDDGSTDATCDVIEGVIREFPQKVRLFRHEKNLGPTGNYQFLIEKARGDFIAHLDGDDYWLPGKLQGQMDFLKEHSQCVAVYSNAVVINDKCEIFGAFNNHIPSQFDLNFLLSKGNFLNHSSVLYCAKLKNEILTIVGPFIDYRIHLRFAQHGQLGHTNQAHVVYRTGSSTSMISKQASNVRRLYLEALEEIPETLRDSTAMRSALTLFYWGEVYLLLRGGRLADAARMLWKIRATTPKGTVLRVVIYPITRIWPKLLTAICRNSSQLTIFHYR